MHPNFNEAFLALVIGMGGVLAFLTVLTLITAMITRVWKEPVGAPPAPAPAPGKGPALPPAPVVTPEPREPEAPTGAEAQAVAAAVAVALHLRGVSAGPGPEVAAAIATSLALHQVRSAAPAAEPGARGSPWRLAGSLEAMGGRFQRRGRPASR